MPNREQLSIIVFFELLAILYVLFLAIEYTIEYWYVLVTAIMGVTALKIWWRRRHPLYCEDDELEPVHQE